MASQNVVQFTDANFDSEVINSETPVLVDFWAANGAAPAACSPPPSTSSPRNTKMIKVGKVDTDANRNTAMKFSISAIPTVIVFKRARSSKNSGLRPKASSRASWMPRLPPHPRPD